MEACEDTSWPALAAPAAAPAGDGDVDLAPAHCVLLLACGGLCLGQLAGWYLMLHKLHSRWPRAAVAAMNTLRLLASVAAHTVQPAPLLLPGWIGTLTPFGAAINAEVRPGELQRAGTLIECPARRCTVRPCLQYHTQCAKTSNLAPVPRPPRL